MVLIIGCIEMLLYFHITYKISKNLLFSFLYTLLVSTFARGFLAARGQLFSLFMFLIIYYSLDKYFSTYKKRYIAVIILALPIIAYTHGSVYVMTCTLFLPYIVEFIASKIKNINFEGKIIINDRKVGILVVPLIIFIVLGLITPNKLNLLTYSYKTMQGPKFISEMNPVGFFDDIFFSVSLVIFFLIVGFSKTKIRLVDLLYIVGYSLVAFKAARGMHYFYLIASICVFRIVCDYLNDYGIKLGENKNIGFAPKFIISICMVFIFISSINKILLGANNEFIPYEDYPVDAADFIINNVDYKNNNIYISYSYGSYFEFRGIPVFIDSRAEVFTPEFNENTTILNDFYYVFLGEENYNAIFQKYDIKYVVLQKSSEIIYNYIRYDDDWKMVYDDISFVVYEKK